VSAFYLSRFIFVVTFYCQFPFLSVPQPFNEEMCNVVTITFLHRLEPDLLGVELCNQFCAIYLVQMHFGLDRHSRSQFLHAGLIRSKAYANWKALDDFDIVTCRIFRW
jgi:hypothetical protein